MSFAGTNPVHLKSAYGGAVFWRGDSAYRAKKEQGNLRANNGNDTKILRKKKEEC